MQGGQDLAEDAKMEDRQAIERVKYQVPVAP